MPAWPLRNLAIQRLLSRALTLGATLFLISGCNLTKFVADSMAEQLRNNETAFFSEISPRHAREAAPALLKFLDGFIVSSPENPDLLGMGASMNAGLAIAMIRYEDKDFARALFTKAQDYAERAMAVYDESLLQAITSPDGPALDQALAGLDRESAGLVFWYVLSKGGRADVTRGEPDLIADLPRLVKIMHRVAEVNPEYFDGGPDAFLGQYYIGRSETLGGSLSKAQHHFAQAEKLASNRFLLVPVFYAEGLLNQELSKATRAEFESALQRVLAAQGPKDRALITALAQAKAVKLLSEIEEHFPMDLLE